MTKKKKTDEVTLDTGGSSYEDLLKGFGDLGDEPAVPAGGSEDSSLLAELLQDIDAREEIAPPEPPVEEKAETVSAGQTADDFSSMSFADLDLNDVTVATGGEAGGESEGESGGIELDFTDLEHDSTDYASLLSELSGGTSDAGNKSPLSGTMPPAPASYSHEVSYTGYIARETGEESSGGGINAAATGEFRVDETPEADAQGDGLSYASLLGDDDSPSGEKGSLAADDAITIDMDDLAESQSAGIEAAMTGESREESALTAEDTASAATVEMTPEPSESMVEDDFLAGFSDTATEAAPQEEEPAPVEEALAEKPADDDFVIASADEDDGNAGMMDFLKLDETTKPGGGPVVMETPKAVFADISLDTIAMDPREQAETVTRAELLLAQGKTKQAMELYAHIAKEKGITPFVAKRLESLGISG